jgi:hypothetical protein
MGRKTRPKENMFLRWAPRILSIALAAFLVLFSFDVFDMEGSWLLKIGAFIIHSLPSIVLAALTFLAWKRPTAGGISFLLFGAIITLFFGVNSQPPSDGVISPFLLIVSLPVFLIGALYLIDGRKRKTTV